MTANSLESRRAGNPRANKSKRSDTAPRALAGAGEGEDQDRQVDSLADSFAEFWIGDSKASGDGGEREITSVNSDQHSRVTSKKQASDGGDKKDKLAKKKSPPNFERTTDPERYKQPTTKTDVKSPVNGPNRVKVEDSSDSGDAIQRKRAEEKEAQRPPKIITNNREWVKSEGSGPCGKGQSDRYYFCSWADWYYVDDSQNAYYEDGTLLHDALFAIHSDQFAIDQISYCFYDNRLLSQAPDGLFYPVQTRHEKSYFHTPSGLHYFDYRQNLWPVVTPEVAPKAAPVGTGSNNYGRSKQSKAGYNHLITSDDVKLFWPGSCAINLSVFIPTPFCIDETVYWFDMDGLWCQTPGDAAYPVHTWQNDPSERLADKKHYFRTPSSLYYFDYLWNVFLVVTPAGNTGSTGRGRADQHKARNSHSTTSADVKLFWPRSPGIDSGGLIPMTFCIGESVYRFDMDDLWCQAPGDRSYRVDTWQTDPNESIPDRKHHFRAPSGVYYFDYRRNVFSHDGTPFCASSSAIDVGGLLPMTFSIGGTVYWFDVNVLWCQAPGDKCYRVHTWQDDPNESLADRKHHFYTPSGSYYFDYRWNVFSNEGQLLCASPSAMNPGGLLPVTRCVDGTVYWFDMDELWCRTPNDKRYRVHTWQSEPNENLANRKHCFHASNGFYYLDEYRNLYSEDGKLVRRDPSSFRTDEPGIQSFQIADAPFWVHKDGLLSRGTDDVLCRILAWPKVSYASDAKSDSLQTSLFRGVAPWSPTPSNSSPGSVSSVPDISQTRSTQPLFPEPGCTPSAPFSPARDSKPEKSQAQPVARKRGNKDHLKCSYCGKEHIHAHEKDKSEVCPFKDANTGIACDTGFCTKQNMRRHFSMHRAGTLEEYLGVHPLPLRKKNKKVASEPFARHNPYDRHPPPKKQ
ncbi:Chromodomain-helicase-DNA-binding protein 1 [Rhizoctonia solani]|uniref:Chromodomain-helicase-DNA-binding protein 1 n=1 Tax=Rhizoctonia solani TaxID=456999 RepID=A0A0K6G628_9AGAM|nr:Chromodomain-helicase-DNA-binding protein 1 [Rhizoctonia solani]